MLFRSEGFIKDYSVAQDNAQGTITVELKYGPNKEKTIYGIKKISKPGLRVYAKADQVPKVLGGLGIAIVSTSKGVIRRLSPVYLADYVSAEDGTGVVHSAPALQAAYPHAGGEAPDVQ